MQLKGLSSPPPMTEAQLQSTVLQLAQLHGYNLRYHTHDSRRSQPGFPDLVLVSVARGRVLFRELKSDAGKLTPEQALWLGGMKAVGLDAEVWRPQDIGTGRIVNELRGKA